jgi:outer membrane protein assembly factor BamB
MSNLGRAGLLFLSLWLLLTGAPAISGIVEGLRPVALGLSKTGDLYVLDASGKVLLVALSGQNSAPRLLAELKAPWEPSDLTVGQIDGEDHLFIAVSQGNLSQIMQYSGTGHFEKSWFQFAPLSGVCTGASSVYAASWSGGVIYQQPFVAAEKTAPKPFFRFLNLRSVGSLAWDSSGKILYAADLQTGSVYALNVQSMETRLVAEKLGQITALSFDASSKKLYIVDAGGRAVWSLNPGSKNARPTIVVKSEQFRLPSAIVAAKDGTIWVGDPDAHAIFQFSASGPNAQPLRVIR